MLHAKKQLNQNYIVQLTTNSITTIVAKHLQLVNINHDQVRQERRIIIAHRAICLPRSNVRLMKFKSEKA